MNIKKSFYFLLNSFDFIISGKVLMQGRDRLSRFCFALFFMRGFIFAEFVKT